MRSEKEIQDKIDELESNRTNDYDKERINCLNSTTAFLRWVLED
ncbi:unnamed protein product [marine sediment metagenome]|uniref:Uncharacterized protein n=1 Tax=marine sediment metagenome TaxID=412755 RepID=X0SRP6_9ZZZZ